mmetsp:Transcript_27551/g.60641  ORF Transcript_27551/g.60641 Transcript_27551/m.60641 type:complete len:399 (-) Transcript_27551:252-1448(-)|eukprot:CAMPEP_0168185076 /NCGR_PEP_ID=MMETSP0139_2-20121125/13620_1 /TAXON_ID=44445 /ORGANISM="Pseudo-nitzschia australis, Strain 10249 10 AB" /LENGTH=398 /DNA_ID=CAMNT_0008106821 /DNA_START=127 /DNA_END=1323 /DNA_ORIENTATION=-
MGFMKNMFAALEAEVTKTLNTGEDTSTKTSNAPPTRWERAVVALNSIIVQVTKVDPDGVDLVCFGSDESPDWYRNLKNTKGLEAMVNDKQPSGPCHMGAAMSECIQEAMENKDMTKRPVAMLVLTAGKPDDADDLNDALMSAVGTLAESYEKCPLSITFVQIGDDSDAEEYMTFLDNAVQAESAASGEMFDLVDSIKDEDIRAAMGEIKGTTTSGKSGALIGAIAGAALGVGGMYIVNQHQAKKRTEGWSGSWKVTYEGEEVTTLTVTDDQAGGLTIDGFPSGDPATGSYTPEDQVEEDGFVISFVDPSGDWNVEGTVEDEHAIVWSDGTRWDEIPPEGGSFGSYAAAGLGGAAAAGATGYLMNKKFFNKAGKKDQCDYIIVMDRSAKMAVIDTGVGN